MKSNSLAIMIMFQCSLSHPKLCFGLWREVIISSVLYSVRIKETIFVFLTTDDSMFSQAPEALLRLAP